MTKFVFNLQGVMRHREQVEDQRQREFALAQAEMSCLQLRLQTINDSIRQNSDDLRQNHLTGKLDMTFIGAHRRYCQAVQKQAMTIVQAMAVQQKKVDVAQAALAEAAKQRKIIEKLRERQHQAWQADSRRREAAEMDEIGAQLVVPAAAEESPA